MRAFVQTLELIFLPLEPLKQPTYISGYGDSYPTSELAVCGRLRFFQGAILAC